MYQGDYFDWLCEIINLRQGKYDGLIHELYVTPFKWVLELDSNRVDDGLVLRGEFPGVTYENEQFGDDQTCSVLEVLIALARKFDYILSEDDCGDRTRIWFWEMIGNLTLMYFTDGVLEENFSELNRVDRILDIWMSRKFDYDGAGSPFALMHPHRDQTKIQLIDQMNDYILENYINDE